MEYNREICVPKQVFSLKDQPFLLGPTNSRLNRPDLMQTYGTEQVCYKVALVTCGGCQALEALNSGLWGAGHKQLGRVGP